MRWPLSSSSAAAPPRDAQRHTHSTSNNKRRRRGRLILTTTATTITTTLLLLSCCCLTTTTFAWVRPLHPLSRTYTHTQPRTSSLGFPKISLLLPPSNIISSPSSPPTILHAARRWGGVRKKIEGGDEDDSNDGEGGAEQQQQAANKIKGERRSSSSKSEEDEEEQEQDPLAISDAMIDEAMGQSTFKGNDDENRDLKKFTSPSSSSSSDTAAAAEPTKWSMEWLESLSEEAMLALDKKRLMDFLLRDIDNDKEWASVPEQAVFSPEEEMDSKENFYDDKMTEEIFGKMPPLPEGDMDADFFDEEEEEEDDEEEDKTLEDIFGELDEEEEEEDDEDLMRFLSSSAEGRKMAADLLNDDEMRDDEDDEDIFDMGAHLRPEEMSAAEVQEGLKHLLAGLHKKHTPLDEDKNDEMGGASGGGGSGDVATLMAAVKATVEKGDLQAASELLQRMEELGVEVGDLEEHAEALENYRRPLPNKRQTLQKQTQTPTPTQTQPSPAAVPLSGGVLSPEEIEAMKSVGACVGIDLGTTNSALSLIKDGRAILLPSRSTGENVIPSVVRFLDGGKKVIVGKEAQEKALEDSDNTFSSVKRLIGRTLDELVKEKEILGTLNLVRHQKNAHTDTQTNDEEEDEEESDDVAIYCPTLKREVTPEEVSAEILKALLSDAAAYLGQPVNRAVITVPAYFTPEQCAATEKAGQLAGLQRIKLLREPEAAALAYGLDKLEDELIMVFDLGGGTFDVSVLEVGDGVVEVLATFGDNHLGGNDFDQRIVEWLVSEYKKQHGGEAPPTDRATMRRLLEVAEDAKVRLSQTDKVEIALPGLGGKNGKGLERVKLTRQGFEGLCVDLFDRLLGPMRQAALMAGATLGGEVPPEALGGEVVGWGGGGEEEEEEEIARVLMAVDEEEMMSDKKRLAELMRERALKGRQMSKARSSYNKNLNAVRKRNPGVKIREFPQGQVINEVVMVGGATRMPSIQRLVEAVTGIKPRTTVNPDEAVALGAGIHAGVLDGTIEEMEMMSPFQAAVMRGLVDYEARQGSSTARSQKQKKGF